MRKRYLLGAALIFLCMTFFSMMYVNAAVVYGDINLDGKVTSTDSSVLERFVLGNMTIDNNIITDLNSDGKTNSTDVSLIQRYVLGMIDSFPVKPISTVATTVTVTNPPTSSIPTMLGKVEDSGYDIVVGSPSGSNGGSTSVLPDPFTMWDGKQVKSMSDWTKRRRELVVEVEKKILGEKAPPPHKIGGSVTGTVSNTSYTVNVKNTGGSCTFTNTIKLPTTGKAPYPAVIVVGGFNSLDSAVLNSEGVAVISYDAYALCAETSGNYSSGKYFDANPTYKGKTGALVAWAWGVSRMIDLFEKNPGVIDPTKIAIHGCSRFGKAAFVIGAFDERIALGLPLEPGTGGAAPLRTLPVLGGQTLAGCNGEASWFGPTSKSYSASMAVDMSDVAAMYAPRGLLLMDNAHIDHLAYKANYVGCAAAYEVFKAMGKSDALWYLGSSGNGNHCSTRAEYSDELKLMIQKFLKGNTSVKTGGLDIHSNQSSVNPTTWMSTWKKGTISN